MNVNLGHYDDPDMMRLAREIEQAFENVPENNRRTYEKTLDFAAPAAVPGLTSEVVAIDGVELGDVVHVGAPVATPAGFTPPWGEVTAENEVTIHWLQHSGAPADPDGAGGNYRIDVWRH
jgi:hypothetical protein